MGAQQTPVSLAGAWFPWVRLAIGAICMTLLVALFFVPAFAPWLLRFEHTTADWRTAYLSDQLPGPHPKIAIVAINEATLRNYTSSPIDRGLLTRIVKAVDDAQPMAIGLDVLFLKETEAAKTDALIAAIKGAKSRVILAAWDERGKLEPFQTEFQKSFLARAERPAGYVNLRHERDDVVRYRASPATGGTHPVSFSRLLAKEAGHDIPDGGRPIAWLLTPKDGSQPFLTVPAQLLLADEPGTSAEDVKRTATALAGKIVLIGGDFPTRDKHRTPLSARTQENMAGVMIHANMVADLIDPARGITELLPATVRTLLAAVAVIALVMGWLLWRSNIVHLVAYSFATLGLLAIDALAYKEFRLLLPFTLALAAWFLGVTGGRAARYFVHWLRSRSEGVTA